MATATTASSNAAAVAALVLALAVALANGQDALSQCSKYSPEQLRQTQILLQESQSAPVGNAIVSCSDEERACLVRSRLPMADGSCVQLGSPCELQDGSWGMVRANRRLWRSARRLVGECAPPPRCDATHVQLATGRCAQAGQLLCACAKQAPPPPRPFSKCQCTEGPQLQIAPFGGYRCTFTCKGTCSPQRDLLPGWCVVPPFDVHSLAVMRADDSLTRIARGKILGRLRGDNKLTKVNNTAVTNNIPTRPQGGSKYPVALSPNALASDIYYSPAADVAYEPRI